MPPKKTSQEKLRSVKPSGKKDESFFELGTKMSARMVGWAMNSSSRVRPKVPAHRVVNRSGMLTGKIHFDYPEQMQELLEKEGVKVKDDKVQDFEKRFWDPLKEMGI